MNFSELLEQKIEEHKSQREEQELLHSRRLANQRNNLYALVDEIREPLEGLGYYVNVHSGSMNYSRMWKDAADEREAQDNRWQDDPYLHGVWIDIHIGTNDVFPNNPEYRRDRPWGQHGHAQKWSVKTGKPFGGKHDAFIKIAWFQDESGGCEHRWIISPNVCYKDNERVSMVNPLVYEDTRHEFKACVLTHLSEIVAEVVNYEDHLKKELGV